MEAEEKHELQVTTKIETNKIINAQYFLTDFKTILTVLH